MRPVTEECSRILVPFRFLSDLNLIILLTISFTCQNVFLARNVCRFENWSYIAMLKVRITDDLKSFQKNYGLGMIRTYTDIVQYRTSQPAHEVVLGRDVGNVKTTLL